MKQVEEIAVVDMRKKVKEHRVQDLSLGKIKKKRVVNLRRGNKDGKKNTASGF